MTENRSASRLLERLDAIGQALAATPSALGLLGVGAVGVGLARLDAYSDLDFYVVVRAGHKATYLQDLAWLATACPLAYTFQNTVDGFKFLYRDGLYGEFAVFEPAELASVAYAVGRWVWRAPDWDADAWLPAPRQPQPVTQTVDALVNEALTNLFVGLGRYRRGEKLSALRFIQGYAVDRIVDLAPHLETAQPGFEDPFNRERRFEARFPQTAAALAACLPGYDAAPAAARAILQFLSSRFPVNPALKLAIEQLCD